MTRVKKSRKVGKIGVAKTDTTRKVKKTQFSKSTNTSGNKAGSRQQAGSSNSSTSGSKQAQDPRLGSKKSIDLQKYQSTAPQVTQKKAGFKTLQIELDTIEQDQKLEQLLEKQEHKKLTVLEQTYVNKTLKRHKELCNILGIDMVEDEAEQETDPFAQLDAISLDDYKD